MSDKPKRHGAKVVSAVGLTPTLKRKSRARRERLQALTAIERDAKPGRNDLLPALVVRYLAIESLLPAERRVRANDPVQVARLATSIAKFGVCQPILVDGKDRIVHGHHICQAAKKSGLSEVPVITVDHLTQDELRLLSIALNRLGETGQWDEEALRLEVLELIDLGEDVLVTGFETAEMDILILDEDRPAEEADSSIVAVGENVVSRPGDLWNLGTHRLLQADALDLESYRRLMGDGELARIVLTDEPYNVPNVGHVTGQAHHREFVMAAGEMSREEFAEFNREWMTNCIGVVIDGGLLATFIDWRSVDVVIGCGRDLGMSLLNVVVWAKSNAGQGSLWRSGHELLPVFKVGTTSHVNNVGLGRYGRWRSNVWTYPGASSVASDARKLLSEHPTVKPQALLEDALLDITNRGDIVLDPFAGSGSTLIAAESVGRVCRAIEIDSRYCDLIIRRWQAQTGEPAVLVATGETFDQTKVRTPVGEAL